MIGESMTFGWVGGEGVESGKGRTLGMSMQKDVWMGWRGSEGEFSGCVCWSCERSVSRICSYIGSVRMVSDGCGLDGSGSDGLIKEDCFNWRLYMVPKGLLKRGICGVRWRGVNEDEMLTTWSENKNVLAIEYLPEGWLWAGDPSTFSTFLEPSSSTSGTFPRFLLINVEVLATFAGDLTVLEGLSPTFLDAFFFFLGGSSRGSSGCSSYE